MSLVVIALFILSIRPDLNSESIKPDQDPVDVDRSSSSSVLVLLKVLSSFRGWTKVGQGRFDGGFFIDF